ncbi:MAG: beta-galactosidase [Clostridia bacterium]|nr:beta-galactosidase [Clostridia bacterium]
MTEQRYRFSSMTIGTCYYPEHWDESLWADDLRRMQEDGISVIRIGEFAWALFEPEEGVYSFDLFDRFLDLCEQTELKVIFGTVSATPPAWLTHKYPEVLNANMDGVLYRHGMRRHYNYNSPVYLEKCAAITLQLAQHFGKRPSIIGWQIDNELNCEMDRFYSEADSAAFRAFLKEKYGTLDALNAAWGTVFWSQTYTDWEQIFVPRPTLQNSPNPHLHLDYDRFVSESCIRFCGLQAEILRAHVNPGVFITTNGMFGRLDNHRMTRECLDVYTYDSYPNFAFGLNMAGRLDRLRDRWSSKKLTEVRSVCPHFGIMEQQSGAGSWTTRMENPTPRPGQMQLWALQSVAHGADFVSFFRWRTCTFGTEIYWHGLLNYDNRDNRRISELRSFAEKMKQLAPVCGADNEAAFAVVKDYDNVFDAGLDTWHGHVANQSEDAIFEVSQLTHTPFDFLYLQEDTAIEDLLRYKALIMPHACIMTKERADLLERYVRAGGVLVIGCRSAYKDIHGQCVMTPQPGLLQKLTATDIHDFTFTTPAEDVPFAVWDGRRMQTPLFNDVLTPLDGAKVLARYGSSYYAGEAALTENAVGEGRVLHLGSAFSTESARMILDYLGLTDPCASLISAPEDVELVVRRKDGRRWLFALNYQSTPMTVTLHSGMRSLFSGCVHEGEVTLPPYGVQVWEIAE